MDIDLLSKMVKELIVDEDRVVLPGLGCFVAEIVPATFSDKGYTINPPYRRLYFRSKPDEGDSLVGFYAKSNDVEYEVAERIIRDFLVDLKSVLLSRKVVVFPGLGRLRATKENNIFFVADEDLDIYPEGFGLEPISLKTHQETRDEVRAAVADLKQVMDESAPEPEPAPEPKPEPESAQEPQPEPEPASEPQPEPEPEPAPQPQPVPVPDDTSGLKTDKAGVSLRKVFLLVSAVLLIMIAAYMAVGRLCPELVDRFLYTPEELEILNR